MAHNLMPSNERHSTADELEFLSRLGTWSPLGPRSRRNLLVKYRAAMTRRRHWGSINPYRIALAVREALKE